MKSGIKWRIGLFVLALCSRIESKLECKHKYGSILDCFQNETNFKLQKGEAYNNTRTSELTLRACHIWKIDDDAFEYMPLKHLDLAENDIQELPETVFHDIGMDMNFLNISFNKLKDLPKNLFKNMIVLEVLDLKMNQLYLITPETFDPLKKLKYLDLSDNNLVGRSFGELTVHENHLTQPPCDLLRGVGTLEFLSIEGNNLVNIPCFATAESFQALRYLILTKNDLVKLNNPDTFAKLIKMQSLEIGENKLEELHEGIFKPLKNLYNIVLKYNRLSSIPKTIFQNLPSLLTVDLSYNEITNLHENMFNATRMDTLSIVGNKLRYLPFNFCSEIRNSGAQLRFLYFSDNPWECTCLIELLEEVKSMKIECVNHKYNATDPECDKRYQLNQSACYRNTDIK